MRAKFLHPWTLLAITVIAALLAQGRFEPPGPVPDSAPPDAFSAARAGSILRHLLQEGVPHVTGTSQNEVVRDRAATFLRSAGYGVEIQSDFHCNPVFGACSPVDNIIAVKPGEERKHAVLLTAHYDGVRAGPGAGDDGAGVAAVLEIARMASELPPFRNDVVFLLTDSEENGLIGADAFAEHHPLFPGVKAVINLEARGVTGASAMFQTGEGNRSIIRILAKNSDRPVANSLTSEIYRRMPNDTDYSVYQRRGVMGLNFAFSGGVALYHSALDDLNHLDYGSLQHHGDNAWAMLRALGDRDISRLRSDEDAAYIDFPVLGLLHYPVSTAAGSMMVLAVVMLVAIILTCSPGRRLSASPWAVAAVVTMAVVTLLGAWLVSWPLGRWVDMHPLEHPYPWNGRIALIALMVLGVVLSARLFARKTIRGALLLVAWGAVAVLGLVLANRLPGATYLASLPLAAFFLGLIVDLIRWKKEPRLLFANLLGFTTAAYLAFYHFFMVEAVLNFDRGYLTVIPLLLLGLVALPLVSAHFQEKAAHPMLERVVLAVIVSCCLVQQFLPGFTPERPRGVNLVYREADGADAGHLLLASPGGNPGRNLIKTGGFEKMELPSLWGSPRDYYAREVPALGLEGVTLMSQAGSAGGGEWRHRVELRPPQHYFGLALVIPKDTGLKKAYLDGRLALDTSLESKHERSVYTVSVTNGGVGPYTLEFVLDREGPFDMKAAVLSDLPEKFELGAANWPEYAQAYGRGHRALRFQNLRIGEQ